LERSANRPYADAQTRPQWAQRRCLYEGLRIYVR
jgi:hypothetical protein